MTAPRYLAALVALAALTGCEPEPTQPENINVDGTASDLLITWDGPAETIAVGQGATLLWNIALETPGAECVSGLDGGAGVTFGELPEGYVSTTRDGEPLTAPGSLDDGAYEIGVAVCVESGDLNVRSFMNNGASFTVVDGVVVMEEE